MRSFLPIWMPFVIHLVPQKTFFLHMLLATCCCQNTFLHVALQDLRMGPNCVPVFLIVYDVTRQEERPSLQLATRPARHRQQC